MAYIQIGRADAIRLYQYCCTYSAHWIVAKDRHGAYVTGTHVHGRVPPVRYFAGCNPNIQQDAYANACRLFGEGDYREVLPRDWLRKVFNDETINRIQINVTADRLTAEFLRSPL